MQPGKFPCLGRGCRCASRAGQYLTEFALVIGVAATVAVAMQFMSRQVIRSGVRSVTDVVLGPDTPQRQAKRDQLKAKQTLNASATSTATEEGRADFHRTTDTQDASTGTSVNVDSQTRLIPK